MSAFSSPAEKVRKIDLLRTFPVVLGNADIRRGVSAFPTGNDSILHFSLEEGNCLKTKATIESMAKFWKINSWNGISTLENLGFQLFPVSSFNLQKRCDQVQILREFELYHLKRDNSINLACENF